jgi:hypothetical protein
MSDEQLVIAHKYRLRCPCGYLSECGWWCGEGHDNGKCPEFPVRWTLNEDEIDPPGEWDHG